MSLTPITRRQYALWRREILPKASADAWARSQSFAVDELRRRALVAANAADAGLANAHRFITELRQLHARADELASSREGGAIVASLVASAAGELRVLLDSQRDAFRAADAAHRRLLAERLDYLQHCMTGVELLAASLREVGRLRRAAAAGALTAAADDVPPDAGAPLVDVVQLDAVVHGVTDSVRAFCVEKNGVASPLEVVCAPPPRAAAPGHTTPAVQPYAFLGVPQHASFVVSELLKNALAAMIARWTAAGVDDAPPLTATLAATDRFVSVAITDTAGGFRVAAAPPPAPAGTSGTEALAAVGAGCIDFAGHYFATSVQQRGEPTYQYSRDFGAAFSGYGLGLQRCRVYAAQLGGRVDVFSQPGHGCTSMLTIERTGTVGGDVPRELR